MGLNFISQSIIYILKIILLNAQIEILPFLKVIIIETIFNSMLIIIIYPLLQILYKIIGRFFEEKNTATKYFYNKKTVK